MRLLVGVGVLAASLAASSCVQAQPASDTGDPGFPFGPSAGGVQPLAYVQDIKPLLDQNCVECHGPGNEEGGYRVDTYAAVMLKQRPGDARSPIVVNVVPGGEMHQYWTGDRITKATMVFRWMVYYNAAETR